jgi:hypothetical protein
MTTGRPHTEPPQPPPHAVALASLALANARLGEYDAADKVIDQLQDLFGGIGMQVLIIGLADTMLAAHGGATPSPDVLVAPVWIDCCGNIGGADDVPPAIRWAGRFVAARAADDFDAAQALIQSCADDDEFSENLSALLHCVATTVNVIAAQRRRGGS